MLSSHGLDRRLRLGERLALMIHLFMCNACSRARNQFRFLRRAARREGSAPEYDGMLPPNLRVRILDRLRHHM